MKKFKKAGILASVIIVMMSLFCINTSAATLNDGLNAEIKSEVVDKTSANVNAVLTNTNYYAIDGINIKLTVSDNAVLNGVDVKNNITLDGGKFENLQANVKLNKQAATEQTTQTAQSTTQSATEQTTQATQGTTQAVANNTTATKPTNTVTIGNTAKTDKKAVQTGDNNNALVAGVIVLVAAGVMAVAFKKGNRRVLSIMLCATLSLSVVTISVGSASAAENNSVMSFTETQQLTIDGQTVTVTLNVEYPQQAEIHNNTMADLKALNGDKLDITYTKNNTISFLNGRYTNYKITDKTTALNSISALKTLLGLDDKAISLTYSSTKQTDNGDTYYTFYQTSGAKYLYEKYITVGADKNGNALCVSNSIDPDEESIDISENLISSEEAKEAVLLYFAESSKKELKLANVEPRLEEETFYHNLCWVVYGENQTYSVAQNGNELKYIKCYVTADSAEVISASYVTKISNEPTEDVYDNDVYFKNVKTQLMTFKDYNGNSVELPVAKDKDGHYYFIDTERKIFCADTEKSAEFRHTAFTFSSADEVSSVYVDVFKNIRIIYDWYKSYGLCSYNGKGTPILLSLGFEGSDGKQIGNAQNFGIEHGWSKMIFSNTVVSVGLDIAAHEYAHGVKDCASSYPIYTGITGSIEEAYADILGKLVEMNLNPDKCDEEDWNMGKSSGHILRSMSNPHQYNQPEYVGDAYYYNTDADKSAGYDDLNSL